MKPTMRIKVCSDEKWYDFFVAVLKKAVERRKEVKHENS